MLRASKKLLVFAPYALPRVGGLEMYVAHMTKQLVARHGWHIAVVTTSEDGQFRVEHRDGIKIYRLPYRLTISNTPLAISWLWRVRRIIKKERPDIINIHTPVPGLGDIAALMAGRIPVVATYHTGTMKKQHSWFNALIAIYEKALLPMTLARVRHLICASDFVRNSFLPVYRYKSSTINPGVDTKAFVPAATLPKTQRIIFVGSINKSDSHKGLQYLLPAVARLRADGLKVSLSVVGSGDGQADYEAQARQLGIDAYTTFHGRLLGKELVEAYQSATVLALPSSNDSFGMVLAEAMAVGLPVVSTTVGGIPDVVSDGVDGFLVPPHNIEALYKALKTVVSNKALAKIMGDAGLQKARRTLDWSVQVKKTDMLLGKLIRDQPVEQKMKVAVVMAYYHPRIGGAERYGQAIANGVKNGKDFLPFVITTNHLAKKFAVEIINGITIYRLPSWFTISNTPINPLWYFTIKKILRREQAQLVHAHAPVPFMADMAVAAAGKLPTILTYHSGSMQKGRRVVDVLIRLYENIFLKHLFAKVTRIVAVSPGVVDTLLGNFRYKTQTITPAVDLDMFTPSPIDSSSQVITYVGRIEQSSAWKGIGQLITAFAKVLLVHPSAVLQLVGSGDAVETYRKMAQRMGIGKQVHFAGALTGDALAQAYQRSRAIVLPSTSDSESFGTVLIEAMASRRPMIGSRIGGIPYVIEDGVNGLLVAPGRIDELTDAMAELLGNHAFCERLAGAGLSKVQREYTRHVQVTRYIRLYHELVAGRPAIVQLASYYPPHLGGLERVAMEVSQELAAQGWQTEVITSNCGAATAPREEQQLRLRTRRLAAFEFAHTPFMPSFLWRLLRVKKPAIFHLHLSQAFIPELTWLVAKVRGIPYVVHFHLDVQPSGPLGFLFVLYKHTIQKMVLQGARAVIALSPDQKRLIEKRYHKKPEDVLFLPNGVSEQYLAIGRKAREPHFPLRLLFVGRLAAQKRVDRLIEALQRCTAPVELHIAGDGEERQALKSLVGQCNLRNVVFHGALGGRALADMYRRCDVLVMPSDREGMSLVMLEAMAAGLPVIGSNVPGLREHLADTGVLVNNPSPETFARAIDLFYLHRQEAYEAYSRKSHAKAAELSWAHLTKKIGNLYETIYAPEPVRTSRGLVKLTALAALWWVGFLWLRSVPAVPAVVVDVAGFSFLSIVPGMLSLLLFGLKHLAPFGKLAMAVGLSVLELMVVALLGNTLLPLFGIRQPLSARYLIIELSLLVAGLLVANFVNKTRWELPVRAVRQLFRTRLDRLIAFGPIAFVLLAVCGASSLNNGGSNLWIIALLVGIAAYSVFVSLQAKKLSPSVIPTALFFTSLSLLLMTSLRGWYITGHDIQREFVVFQLAKNSGIWQIASYRDAYNACLSITILPTIFSNLLRVADPYVFKVFFQIIFALCPSIVYLMVRRWLQPALAFAATLYFIAFPTFFTDMPMLSRQEIAFLFVALMFYVIFQAKVALGRRRALFLLLSAGLIISHYSTTYSIVAILLATVFVWPPLCRLANWLARKGRLKHSALNALAHGATELKAISLTMTVLIVLGSFLWTVVLTDTGNNTVGVIRATVAAIGAGFKSEGLRSKDTNYNLLSWQSDDPQLLMNGYLTNVVKPAHQQDLGSYYPSSSYPNPAVLPDSGAMPLTSIGNWVSHLGLDVPNFNDIVRQGSAKLLQVLILIGFIYTLFRRRYAHNLSTDFVALSVGSLIFVASQVVLPVLSVEYGLLRAFQQALMLLGLFTVVGSAVLFSPLAKKLPVALLPTLLAVAFFLSSTGVITQLLGGYGAQLHLNNSGQYYDLYYLHTSEVDGTRWLANQQPRVSTDQVQATVQMSNYIFGQLAPHVQVSPLNDIYPSLIRKDSYVFLGYTNVVLGQSTISYNGTLVNYQYSSAFLDNVKDLIYSNGQVKIYR